MAKKQSVIDWLKTNPVFSFSALERRADIPHGYLSKEISGTKIMLAKHHEALATLLAAYGFK